MILRWQPIGDPDLDAYEVRRGSHWAANRVAYVGRQPQADIDEAIGTESFAVRARNAAGRLSEGQVVLTVTTPVPNGWTSRVSRDEQALAWPGVAVDLVNTGSGSLQIAAGAWAGSYTTPVLDAVDLAEHSWSVILDVETIDLETTGETMTWSGDDPRSRELTSEGREPTHARPGYDLDTTGDDLTDSADSYGNALIGTGWAGSVGQFVATCVEVRWSDDGATWTGWREFRHQVRHGRYAQLRVTLKRGRKLGFQMVLHEMVVAAVQRPAVAGGGGTTVIDYGLVADAAPSPIDRGADLVSALLALDYGALT
jgi:hypothetical protein